jgi:hypothetical protein
MVVGLFMWFTELTEGQKQRIKFPLARANCAENSTRLTHRPSRFLSQSMI